MEDDATTHGPAAGDVVVYWRPGCFFCSRLLRGLGRNGVPVVLRNIWEDDEARAIVRSHNNGDETVPTVVVGSLVWTNPDAGTVTDAVLRSCRRVQRSQRDSTAPARGGGPSLCPEVQ